MEHTSAIALARQGTTVRRTSTAWKSILRATFAAALEAYGCALCGNMRTENPDERANETDGESFLVFRYRFF
jgi:hypothetical protein